MVSSTAHFEPVPTTRSFTGELQGLWRRKGQAPQLTAGVGFSAQGFDRSFPYTRMELPTTAAAAGGPSATERAAFIFEGLEESVPVGSELGDFGLDGGGASGLASSSKGRAENPTPNALLLLFLPLPWH